MVTGVLKPDSGNILINDADISKDPLKAKMQIGFVSDTPDNFLYLTGIEYLNLREMLTMFPEKTEKTLSTPMQSFGIEHSLGDKI